MPVAGRARPTAARRRAARPRTRRAPVLATTSSVVASAAPSRTGADRAPVDGEPARARREQHVDDDQQQHHAAATASTVLPCRAQHDRRPTPSSSSSGTRPVIAISARHRGTGTEPSARCEHLADVDALELGLGAQPEPVRQGRAGPAP